jgi:hypothetical protein
MGCGKRMEQQDFRPALRLGRRPQYLYLHGDKLTPTRVFSNYSLARGIEAPVQRSPKVGHDSRPKGERA